MQLLLTRPIEQAIAMAEALRERGHIVHLAPLLRIECLHHDRGALEGASAVIVTSANAVPALMGLHQAVKVFAVGPDTAAALTDAGLRNVTAASGTAESLLTLVRSNWRPEEGTLVYASGRQISVDVAARLTLLGYPCQRLPVYTTVRSRNLPYVIRSLLNRDEIDAALFMSARTADTFTKLIANAGLVERCRSLFAIALSGKIAGHLQKLHWKEILISASPTRAGMLAAVDALRQRYR